jgi:hypothetical protein
LFDLTSFAAHELFPENFFYLADFSLNLAADLLGRSQISHIGIALGVARTRGCLKMVSDKSTPMRDRESSPCHLRRL